MADEKSCSKCGELKPPTEFHRDKATPDGLRTQCKACAKAIHAAYAQANRETLTRKHAEYVAKNREKIREINRRSNEKHHEEILERDRTRWQERRDAANARKREKRAADPDANREYQRQWRLRNPESVKVSHLRKQAKRRERMASDPEFAKAYRERRNATRSEYNARIRLEVIAAYGGKCFCCGESNPYFLSLDHVNNDGSQHLKNCGAKMGGDQLYLWARKNNYPDRLRVACFNCNLARQFYGKGGDCPHKLVESPVSSAGQSEALLYL